MTEKWIFDGWNSIARVLVVGCLAYFAVVIVLRVAGNRTLAKSAAFDHVVTVAFGSVLATTLLSNQTSLVSGTVAFVALVVLQFAVAFSISRATVLQNLLVHRPTVVLERGELLHDAMRRARVSESDVHAALRKTGIGRISEAALVTLESDGTFSTIRNDDRGPLDALEGIREQVRP